MSTLNAVLHQLETEYEGDSLFTRAEPAPADVERWWTELGGRRKAQQIAAREQLITHFAPLVTQVATRMIGRLPDTVELGDLVSYGMFGLIDAVERFEPERGLKFETYASTRVRGAIIDELRAADWVPRSVRSKARSLEAATRMLEQSLQRTVADGDVAEQLGWEVDEVRDVRAQVALSHVAALDGLGGPQRSPGFEVVAAALRIRVTATNGADEARVYEVRAYA